MEAAERHVSDATPALYAEPATSKKGRAGSKTPCSRRLSVVEWDDATAALVRDADSPSEIESPRLPDEPAPSSAAESRAPRAGLKDAVGLYLAEIRRYRLLTAEEEVSYSRAARAGDIDARDVMITRNLRLVVSIAKRYQGLGLSFSDLIEEGNLGLVRAIERFDWSRGLRFSTYASKWIRQAITRSLVNKSRTVRIPSNVLALLKRIAEFQLDRWQAEGRRATSDEICKALKISRSRFAEVHGLLQQTLSLDSPVDPYVGHHRLHDILAAPQGSDPSEAAYRALEGRHVARLLDVLSAREQHVLRLRFGFDGEDPRSLEETGLLLGVTRERIRQIEGRALSKLRGSIALEGETLPAGARVLEELPSA